ncbi:LOW QUALITY PROTEIN: hydroxyacyl-CoA dehydrogenase trifunctional multienzyme complex subunit alpha a [Embiotoca jacksoni]|uniref:LOW QUALITY PROTEIN: hydroxyacyl-CoA dehydrogenase trifunctional multienzyme complex subunit alpha a n=1 Tax=Embiotoca jacksoni TaxID=100190 RepID=UPI003703733C
MSWVERNRYRVRMRTRTHVNYELKDDVAVVRLNDPTPKVNTLSSHVQSELTEVIGGRGGGWMPCSSPKSPGCFIAGDDVNSVRSCSSSSDEVTRLSQEGQEMLERIEISPVSIVAAVQQRCLDGGLELSIACQYRIDSKSKKKNILGTPEVMLGPLPGAGGTQRLPKMVGLPEAFDMMLTGKNIRADEAKETGLVQQLVDPLDPGLEPAEERTIEYLEEVAVGVAKEIANKKICLPKEKSLVRKMQDTAMDLGPVRKQIYKTVSEKVQKQTKGFHPAPLKKKKKKNSPLIYFTIEPFNKPPALFFVCVGDMFSVTTVVLCPTGQQQRL